MALTDVAIKNAKSHEKPYKMGDAGGLFLLVQPSGGKLWRLKYRVDGREKKLAIGPYPEISLAEARRRRDDARTLIVTGKDPSREKQRDKVRSRAQAESTFAAITKEYCAKRKRDGDKAWAAATATRSEYLLSLLDSSIGRVAIAEIKPPDVLAAVRKMTDPKTTVFAPECPGWYQQVGGSYLALYRLISTLSSKGEVS